MHKTAGFYSYAELYFRVRTPDPTEVEDVVRLIRQHARRPLRRLLDPTCGPGNWLHPLSKHGFEVAGVDNSAEMCAFARSIIPHADIRHADSFDPAYAWPHADCVFELAGVLSIFLEGDGLRNFLSHAADCVPTGGVAAFTVFGMPDNPHQKDEDVHWRSDRVMADGMHVHVEYRSLEIDPVRRTELMRRTIVAGSEDEAQIISDDSYTLKLYNHEDLAALKALAEELGFEFREYFDPNERAPFQDHGGPLPHNFILLFTRR